MMQISMKQFSKLKQAIAKVSACVPFAVADFVAGFAYVVLVLPSNNSLIMAPGGTETGKTSVAS